jgi:hypothetical protein
VRSGQTVINAESFLADLVIAKDRYFDDIIAHPVLLALTAPWGQMGIMGEVVI